MLLTFPHKLTGYFRNASFRTVLQCALSVQTTFFCFWFSPHPEPVNFKPYTPKPCTLLQACVTGEAPPENFMQVSGMLFDIFSCEGFGF